jgi:hypothetical protein
MRLKTTTIRAAAVAALLGANTGVQAGDGGATPLQYRAEGTFDPALLPKPSPSNGKRSAPLEHRAEDTYDPALLSRPGNQSGQSGNQSATSQTSRVSQPPAAAEQQNPRNNAYDLKLVAIQPVRPNGDYGRGYLTRFGHWNPPRYSPMPAGRR